MLTLKGPSSRPVSRSWVCEGFVTIEQWQVLHALFYESQRHPLQDENVKAFRAANPFFQGGSRQYESNGWVYVEFFHDNQTIILAAAEAMGRWLGEGLELA